LSRARVGSARSRAARLRVGERGRGDPHGTRQRSGAGRGTGALQRHGRARRAVELTMTEKPKEPRFVALCMLGLVLFNFPSLALFNVGGTIICVPVLYACIFSACAFYCNFLARIAYSLAYC